MKVLAFILLSMLVLVSCSGIGTIAKQNEEYSNPELYSKDFIEKFSEIKKDFSQGKEGDAFRKIEKWNEKDLRPVEIARKTNFHGLLLYRQPNKLEKALDQFKKALKTAGPDKSLSTQINKNLANAYYKKSQNDKAYEYLSKVDVSFLNIDETYDYYYLRYLLMKGSRSDSLFSLVKYFGKYKQYSALKNDALFNNLLREYSTMDSDVRFNFLTQFEDQENLAVVYLGGVEAEKLFYLGDKNRALSLINWVKNHFSYDQESTQLLETFNDRINNFAKINLRAVGVVLPLSGKKQEYAKRVMLGIDAFYQKWLLQDPGHDKSLLPELFTKDSRGDGVVGAMAVRDLAKLDSVAVIIGGLFSDEAQKEYLEAKKNGIFFISLSQVFLPESEKDYLLLEVPGSTESQVEKIFADENISHFGRRAGILYSDDERGQSYMRAFAKMAKNKSIEITAAQSFPKTSEDFRPAVEKFLSIKFTRERQEEYDLLSKTYAGESNGNRRVHVLGPVVDFDWVFIPAYPDEAVRLIPTFRYYDVNKMNYIGIPSWRSTSLEKMAQRIPFYFIGDDVKQLENGFKDFFFERNKEWPGLIEISAYTASKVSVELLKSAEKSTTRTEFLQFIQSKNKIEDSLGGWNLKDNLWIKEMRTLKFWNQELNIVN